MTTSRLALVGLLLALAALLSPMFSRAVQVWAENPNLNFGFLIPPVAVGLAWGRRTAIRASVGPGAPFGLGLVISALVLLLVSEHLWARSPSAVAAGLLVWGVVAFCWGWATARLLAYPIGLVTASLALQPTLLSGLGFWLQGVTAVGAGSLADHLGLPVVREGLVLRSHTFAFIVSEACSGMNSLMALLMLASVWIYVSRGGPAGRGTIVACVLPLVLVANTMRVTLVLLIAYWYGQDAALGFFHQASSLALFGMAFAGLLVVSRIVGCRVSLAS